MDDDVEGFTEDDKSDLQEVMEQVLRALGCVLLVKWPIHLLSGQWKHKHLIYVEGALSIQLGKVTKLYAHMHQARARASRDSTLKSSFTTTKEKIFIWSKRNTIATQGA